LPSRSGKSGHETRAGAEGLMSRSIIILIIIVIIIAGALWYLSTQAQEVPVQSVEIDVTNEIDN
jgi:preprotein translocase subunit SecG